jgi:hypothetical protein
MISVRHWNNRFNQPHPKYPVMDPKVLIKAKKSFRLTEIDVASSPWKMMLGLMFRSRLPKGRGMLFDFHFSDRHGIWMLFMRFPIDIHFLDADGNTVDVVKRAVPMRLLKPSTWKIYKPRYPCRYAVETAA